MSFGNYFKQLRVNKNFTQEEIAVKIGKSKMLVSGVETGRNDAFVDDDLEKIAIAFALSRDEKIRLFYEASKSRNRFPSYIHKYLVEHEEAYAILDIMSCKNMNSDMLQTIKEFVEGFKDVENG